MNIPFNRPCVPGTAAAYIGQSLSSGHLSGDGPFSRRCAAWLEGAVPCRRALIMPSATAALETAAALCGLTAGDEVILPSFTFSSTANAFVAQGAALRFVDIDPATMNIDPACAASAVTPRTRVLVVVHYAGVACEMDPLLALARRHGLLLVEDAAQGILAAYKGRPLGGLGDAGCFSFHETKNIGMGEGGALLLPKGPAAERAEIIREKGTDRSRYFRGQVDKYSWVEWGSSYLQNDLSCAYLYSQLEMADAITADRRATWNAYRAGLAELAERGRVELPFIPEYAAHNAHIFYIKTRDISERTALIAHMKARGVYLAFHYVPLHSAPAGLKYGRFVGEDRHTTQESERLVRLPLYYGMTGEERACVLEGICDFYRGR